jgi:chromosome segregation protein
VRELETAVNRNKQLLVESDQEQKQLHHDLLQNENEVEFLQRQKEELTAEVSEKEQLYYGLRGSIEEFDNKIKQALKNKENVDQLLTALKDKYNQLQYNLVSLKERLSIEFHLDINELLQQEMDGEIDKEDMEQKVGKMKKTLENFGEVNPFAVDAYKEVKERYDFLIAQKDDLENAKLSLQQTIAEVEKAATEKFLVSFNQVRENFQIVFKQLFTEGDTCDLILTEPDNPLESKVEIMARPKGKRPLTIDALSGGEKSLTAISLIFGLYLIKPAPFCVLDEVDAPLDDENVDKFNKMVQTFSANSQFIVVTHNKKTMSYVKRIYGIVMAKTGISRAVAVDFASLN